MARTADSVSSSSSHGPSLVLSHEFRLFLRSMDALHHIGGVVETGTGSEAEVASLRGTGAPLGRLASPRT
jgi:hypothetical protein